MTFKVTQYNGGVKKVWTHDILCFYDWKLYMLLTVVRQLYCGQMGFFCNITEQIILRIQLVNSVLTLDLHRNAK